MALQLKKAQERSSRQKNAIGGGLINHEIAWGDPSVAEKDRTRVRISDEAPKDIDSEMGQQRTGLR